MPNFPSQKTDSFGWCSISTTLKRIRLLAFFLFALIPTWAQATLFGPIQSIAPSGADPFIALSRNNEMIAYWWTYDSLSGNKIVQVSTSQNEGTYWSSPQTISFLTESSDSPRIVFATNSENALAIWLSFDGTLYNLETATSPDAGKTWTRPQTLASSLYEMTEYDIALSASGCAIASWANLNSENITVIYATNSSDWGQTWAAPQVLSRSDAFSNYPSVAISERNETIAAWVTTELETTFPVITSIHSDDGGVTWYGTKILAVIASPYVSAPQVGISTSNFAVLSFVRKDPATGVLLLRATTSRDFGDTWSPILTVSSGVDNAEFFSLVVDSKDEAILVWEERNPVSQYKTIFSSHFIETPKVWSSPVILSRGTNNVFPFVNSSFDHDAVISWWTTQEGVAHSISEDHSSTWSTPELFPQENDSLDLAVLSPEKAYVVWTSGDGLPGNLEVLGRTISFNRTSAQSAYNGNILQMDYYVCLNWDTQAGSTCSVYQNGTLLGSTNSSHYEVHHLAPNTTYLFKIVCTTYPGDTPYVLKEIAVTTPKKPF